MIRHLNLLFGFVTLALSVLTVFVSAYAWLRPSRRGELMGLVSLMGVMLSVEAAMALLSYFAYAFWVLVLAPVPHTPHANPADAAECPYEIIWWVRSLSYIVPLGFHFTRNRTEASRAFLFSTLTLLPRVFFFVIFVVFKQISC